MAGVYDEKFPPAPVRDILSNSDGKPGDLWVKWFSSIYENIEKINKDIEDIKYWIAHH